MSKALRPLLCTLLSLLSGLLVAACAGNQGVVAETISPAGSEAYAEEYPERLTSTRQQYEEGSTEAQEEANSLPAYPDDLADPDWVVVHDVYTEADQAGRSQAVVEALRDARRVKAFHEEAERDLSRRLIIHVNGMMKNRGTDCDYPAGPALGRVLGDAVDEALDDRYRELNEAHRLLEEREEELGDDNVSALEEQVDRITGTSFFVYVDAPTLRDELNRMIEDGERVSETLDEAIAAERAKAADPDASRGEQQAAEERIEELQAAQEPIEGLIHNAEVTREGIDDQITQLREAYEAALQQLLDDVESRQPPPEE